MTGTGRVTVDHLDHEVSRFSSLLDAADLDAPVPTCEGWNVLDLVDHVAVLHRWVADLVASRVRERPDRPERDPDDDPVAWARESGRRLVQRFTTAEPDPALWAWTDTDDGLAFWLRRMAHETLVHRLDLELAVGVPFAAVEPEFAHDGIDELLEHFAEGVPDWLDFVAMDRVVGLTTTDTGGAWRLELGRATGATRSGRELDLPAMVSTDRDGAQQATVTLPAARLHRWLWGRDDVPPSAITGSPALVAQLRSTIADAT